MSNVFYLPGKMIPEQILLHSEFVTKIYGLILEKYEDINSKNAKEIVREISIFDHGDDMHINDTISVLANKWSLEENDSKDILVSQLNIIFGM